MYTNQTYHLLLLRVLLCIVCAFTVATAAHAQAPPDAVSFQAVARTADGLPMSSKLISIRLQIRKGDSTGVVVYDERHTVQTDDLGHFSVEIGRGTSAGPLSTIDWSAGPFYLSASIDTENNGNWVSVGSQEMLSVPYALYSRRARVSDTSNVAMDLGIVLPTRKGGTGSSADPIDGGVAYGDNGVFNFTLPGRAGEILTSTGGNAPSWQALKALIDTSVVNVIDSLLINDRSFMDSVYKEVSERVSKDTMVIRSFARDSIVQRTIRETVHEVLADTNLWKRWYRVIRDSLLRDSAFVQPLYVTIREQLAGDSVFINALFKNRLFVQRLEELIDASINAKAWSLTGNSGTGALNFLGTKDDAPLMLRTNGLERVRIDAAGNVGIGLQQPERTLDIQGSLGFTGNLAISGNSGQNNQVLVSRGSAQSPRWTSDLDITSLKVSDTAIFNGPAVFNDTVIMRRNWSLALQDRHIFVGGALGTAVQEPPGSEGQYLRIVSGRPQWSAPPPQPESWIVGGNTTPSSTILGNMSGDLQLAAGGQPWLRIAGADGRINAASLSGVPAGGGLALTDGVVVASAGGDMRKVDASTLVASLGGFIPVTTGQTTVDVTHAAARPTSIIVATYEDLNDTEFIFCQVVAKASGSFRIRLSGAPRSQANARINYFILNP